MIVYNGIEYIRVSDVLSQYSDYSKIDPDVLERKRAIGSEVHEAIYADATEGFPLVNDASLGYWASYDLWRIYAEPRYVVNERRYYCDKLQLTGKIDALVLLPGDEFPSIIDFKTCATASHGVWSMQGHMYGYLLRTNGIEISDRYLFLKLDKDGGMPKVCEYWHDDNTLNKCFEAIEHYKQSKATSRSVCASQT